MSSGPTPDGDERVLNHFGDEARVGGTAAQADDEPRRVAVVQLPQRTAIVIRDCREQLRISAGIDPTVSHTPPVASRTRIGSSRRPIDDRPPSA